MDFNYRLVTHLEPVGQLLMDENYIWQPTYYVYYFDGQIGWREKVVCGLSIRSHLYKGRTISLYRAITENTENF